MTARAHIRLSTKGYSCPRLTEMDALHGGSPWGAGYLAGADGSRQVRGWVGGPLFGFDFDLCVLGGKGGEQDNQSLKDRYRLCGETNLFISL